MPALPLPQTSPSGAAAARRPAFDMVSPARRQEPAGRHLGRRGAETAQPSKRVGGARGSGGGTVTPEGASRAGPEGLTWTAGP